MKHACVLYTLNVKCLKNLFHSENICFMNNSYFEVFFICRGHPKIEGFSQHLDEKGTRSFWQLGLWYLGHLRHV